MSLSALIRRMAEAGAPPEAIALAVEAIEAEQAKDAARRAKRAAAKASERERLRLSRDNPATVATDDRDKGEPLPPPVSPLVPSPRPLTQNPPLSPTNPTADAGAEALDGELILPIAKPKPPPNAARGCRIPPGFPGDEEREWTKRNLGFSDDDFEQCRDEFRDYWSGVPGQRGVKCDWPATFRNGARKHRPRSGSRQAYPSGNQRSDGSVLGAYQRAAARVRAQNDVSRQRAGVFDHGEREVEMRYGIPAE